MPSLFKRLTASITALAVFTSSTVAPLQAHASDRANHYIDPRVNELSYNNIVSEPYSRSQCGNTPTLKCEFMHVVPLDVWEEVASLYNPTGANTPVDGRQYYEGQRWMALGLDAAGALGLQSADIVYKTIQEQIGQPPWIIGRYLPEKAELRIHAVKVIKTPDGYQRVLTADYTPDHGRWHVIWRHFLRPAEKRDPYVKGIDPFTNFSRGLNTKTFVNVSPGAAQAIMGQAMMHHKAPFALLIEPTLRIHQWQTSSGNIIRKKITTHTRGYAKPKIYFAAPLNMTADHGPQALRAMGMYCPRSLCQTADEVVASGVVFQPVSGGNIPAIEDLIYSQDESKSSFTVAFFALVTAALTWGIGAALANSASWGFSAATGFVPSAAGVTSASTITAAAGAGYAALSAFTQGLNLTNPQRDWLGAAGVNPSNLTNGTMTAANAHNHHAQALFNEASRRHIQTGNPGTAQAGGNLSGTQMMVQGNCPLDWGIKECEAAGLDPGQAPRKDMHTNRAMHTQMYMRKVDACQRAGLGNTERELHHCLATRVFIEPPTQQ